MMSREVEVRVRSEATSLGPTAIDHFESTPAGAQELAAARLAVNVNSLLSRAFTASGATQKELAGRLGLTEGRVSQVLKGDGNVMISTVGRFLRAMGYQASLTASPADHKSPPIDVLRHARRRRRPSGEWRVVESDGTSWAVQAIATRPQDGYLVFHAEAIMMSEPKVFTGKDSYVISDMSDASVLPAT